MKLNGLRRLTLLSLAVFALKGFIHSGESDLPSGGEETANSAVEETAASPRGSTHSAAKAVPVSAVVSLNLDRPERKLSGGEVYDLFSRTTRPARPIPPRRKPVVAEALLKEPTSEPRSNVTAESAPRVQPDIAPQVPPEPSAVAGAVPPPPPVVVVAPAPPPPAPAAPALPFQYIGRMVEAGQTVFFLTKGDKLYTVRVGDDIDGLYSIDGEMDGQLKLIYKPLSIAQTLAVGASS